MTYKEPESISDSEFNTMIATGDEYEIGNAIFGWVLSSPDRSRSEDICVKYASSPSLNVRRTVASCVGHIARIHHQIDLDRMVLVLNILKSDPDVRGYAETSEDDIDVYIKRRRYGLVNQ